MCRMVQDGARWCKMVQDSATPCNTMRYLAIPCNTMQNHAVLINADGAYHCLWAVYGYFLPISLFPAVSWRKPWYLRLCSFAPLKMRQCYLDKLDNYNSWRQNHPFGINWADKLSLTLCYGWKCWLQNNLCHELDPVQSPDCLDLFCVSLLSFHSMWAYSDLWSFYSLAEKFWKEVPFETLWYILFVKQVIFIVGENTSDTSHFRFLFYKKLDLLIWNTFVSNFLPDMV